ncbi:MAG: hypothetical protein LBJ94_01310 [Puniceicoccales bacterium]|jgi:N-glycosylase/DNA lyase|nr:hypothetical protein [Puniceicoccales bacterium]
MHLNRVEIKSSDFSIEQIANSGQCFRINRLANGNIWIAAALGKVLKIQRLSENEHIFFCSPKEYQNIWMDYFDLNRDYGAIRASILGAGDAYLAEAVKHGFGLRILKQDIWEVLLSFIISQRNSIPRIKNTVEKLCAPYGNLFPTPEILAKYGEQDFRDMGLGYRAKYLLGAARAVDGGKFDIGHLKTLGCGEAVSYLKGLSGVGEKVANCVALYGLHKLEAFPVDVWMRRIIAEQYGGKLDIERFHGYAGIAQQYMFFYQRSLKK